MNFKVKDQNWKEKKNDSLEKKLKTWHISVKDIFVYLKIYLFLNSGNMYIIIIILSAEQREAVLCCFVLTPNNQNQNQNQIPPTNQKKGRKK